MKLIKHLRLAAALIAATCVAACAVTQPAAPPKPKLIVFLAVDGLPERQITDYRDQLAPDGFARFLDRGAWFTQAYYGHAFTVTGAGHATMLSGAYPDRSGIIGNNWLDQTTGEDTYCTGDTSATYIGHKTDKLDGTSPKNLLAETVGDVLKRSDPKSKVIGMSGKDRGAILPAGKTGVAYMYMDDGDFASTTFYMKEHPAWVNDFNARKPADRYFGQSWKALLPEQAYARSVPDDRPWFGPGGGRLPMMMAAGEVSGAGGQPKPGRNFYRSLLRGPFADTLLLEFARAAIAGEQLGQDDSPDIISISLSGHDYVNHAFGAESRISHDHLLQLDRMLQAFFQDLDRTVGKDNYIAMLTADHGFAPAPEYAVTQGLSAGRLNPGQSLGRINAELQKRFGLQKLVIGFSGPALLLDKQLIAQGKLDLDTVADAARQALLAEPAIGAAWTRAELISGSRAADPLFGQARKSWNKDRSGEVQFVLKPYWIPGSAVATHGSPYEYDTHVPILAWGPRWIKPGRVDARVEVVDIAPTLSGILGIAVPAMSQGKLLPLP
jgi:predicted AlkP superfamily pyrophosphatase or phosphodiesterase